MPEGDTVLRTAQGLHRALTGRLLTRVDLRWPGLDGSELAGREVVECTAYGKHIFTRIGAGRSPRRFPTLPDDPLTLHSHLRMDGSWKIAGAEGGWPRPGGVSVRAVLGTDRWVATGIWLGMLDLVPTAAEHELIAHLGPDVMTPGEQTIATGVQRIAGWPDRPVGAALLDQRGVAGIGTIFMAESLFLQGISPWTPVREVDLPPLLERARTLLVAAARGPGSNTTGMTGFRRTSYVHGRKGLPCHRCGTVVRVAGVGGPASISDEEAAGPAGSTPSRLASAGFERPAFYCPTCQAGPQPADDGRPVRPLGANPRYRENRRPRGYYR